MAGESPDRSKQQGASAEPTSGSGTPVPGPTAADPDPRLAMAGEKARVDQVTTVFSTRGGSAGSAVDASRVASDGAAGSEVRGNGSGGDGATRASLASWVRSAVEVEVEDEDEDKAEGKSGAEAGSEGAADESGAEAGDGPTSDAADGRSGEAEDAASDGDETEQEPSERAAGESSEEAVKEPAEKSSEGAEKEESVGGESEGEGEGGSSGESGAETGDTSEPETEAGDAPGATSVGADASEDASEDASAADDDAEEATEADGEDAAKPVAEDASSAEPDPGADPEHVSKTEGKDTTKPSVDQATAVFKAVRKPAVDQPTTMLKLGGGKPSGKSADKQDKAPSDKQDSAEAAESPEPTADKPAVDQPTTMLKLGGGKPSGKSADKQDKPAPKPPAESEPERTSKFVALKPLDEPKSRQPKSTQPKPAAVAADATTALPQVGPERTAQQPLPPKPPLDLLAELTNTPPPPETPVRTIVRRIKIWTPLVLLLAIIFAIVQAVRPLPTPTLALSAADTYTFGGGKLGLPWPGQGQSAIEVEGVGTVGTDGKQTPKPIASVTKIMTAYVTLQEHPLKGNEGGPQITVDQQAEDESKHEDESTAAMKKGQKFTERQMLMMLMIPSGNNAARLLARWDSDNKTFVGKMNAAAKKLGMTNTVYTDPSGLDKSTVSTAVDQLKLAKQVMQNPVFRSIVGMAKATKADIPGLAGTIYNTNDLLVTQVGVIGLKTGSSTPAGGDLVWAATKVVDGSTRTIYGAVLNQDAHTGVLWDSLQLAEKNSQKLINKVQQSLTTATVVKKGEVVGYVDDQLGGKTPVVATENLTAVGWPGLTTSLSISGTAVPHEAKAGTVVGKLTVGDGSSHAVTIPVALQKDLTEPGYGAKFTRLG